MHLWLLDEIKVQEKRRIEGAFVGVHYFCLYIAVGLLRSFILGITYELTGFDPYVEFQSPLTQWGILIYGISF